MILKRKLLLVFAFLFILSLTKTIKAQPTPSIGIVLNEYCVTNTSGPTDNFGVYSDWVEIANVQSYSVTLANYYLSNDRNNLKKWAFPSSFSLPGGGLGVVWLSGKNGVFNSNYHANFTLDQCKNQWLILSTSAGTIRDSVFVQQTKAGHTRGRIDYNTKGINAWRLYTTNSQMIINPLTNNYMGYLPKPSLAPVNPTGTLSIGNATSNTGFFAAGSQIMKVMINGRNYDTINYPCLSVYYTTNGDYPRPGSTNTKVYIDSSAPNPINIDLTTVVRVIVVPRTYTSSSGASTLVCSEMSGYLESFCETNTYFVDPGHQTFSKDFGVVSIAMDYADTSWFSAQGNPPATTIHVEYYDKMKQVSEGYGSIERPINETWATKQRGYYISIDDRNGFGCNFEGPIFNLDSLGSSKRRVFPTLHLYGGDIESHSSPLSVTSNTSFGTSLRDVFIESLAAKYNLNVNPLHIKPVVAFVNGKYAGMYHFKEVYDKYYENYYYGQSKDSVDMCFYHNGEGSLTYSDGTKSNFNNNFRSNVVDKASASSLKGATNPNYTTLMNTMDKTSFIDYMILQSFFLNSNLWNYNIAFAKGGQAKAGNKYHFYLWNMPAILNFTSVATNTLIINNTLQTPCVYEQANYQLSTRGFNGAAYVFGRLMNGITGNDGFKLEYKNRYQDLLNNALKCDNLMKHYNYVYNLYRAEIRCHEDPSCAAGNNPFNTVTDLWDTNVYRMKIKLLQRCDFVANSFTTSGCYGVTGPYPLTIRVEPEGAGTVKVNTLPIASYPWTGNYYATLMSFKATPSNTTNFSFHHWKFQNHTSLEPSSKDSVTTNFYTFDDVTAVFTDKSKDISNSGDNPNIPTGFTPNGDGRNDYFKPLGSAEFVSEYQMSIWNRWGQEVYRSVDPNDLGWDGNFSGQMAITGVYAYVITYKNVYGESKLLKGNVTLTR
ncbi:MAG: gliding motility-associated C-terminal domain-containing protein [Bacteroidota bacterium]